MPLAAALLAACDRALPTPSNDRPSVHVTAFSPGAEPGVGRDQAIRFRFDRFLRPTTVLRQSIYVTTGLLDPVTGESPAGGYHLEPRYDPYERMAVFALPPGGRWSPEMRHTVRLRPPADEGDVAGIRAFDGASLAEATTYTFETSGGVTDPSHDVDDAWSRVDWCDEVAGPPRLPSVRKVLGVCAHAGCHGGAEPAADMGLGSVSVLREKVLGVAARGAPETSTSGEVVTRPTVFGEGMPRVDPGSPGNSYLIYKLLIHPLNHPAPGDPEALETSYQRGLPPLEAPEPAELERLRDAFVTLEPMPAKGWLKPSEMRALVIWIARGAELRECP